MTPFTSLLIPGATCVDAEITQIAHDVINAPEEYHRVLGGGGTDQLRLYVQSNVTLHYVVDIHDSGNFKTKFSDDDRAWILHDYKKATAHMGTSLTCPSAWDEAVAIAFAHPIAIANGCRTTHKVHVQISWPKRPEFPQTEDHQRRDALRIDYAALSALRKELASASRTAEGDLYLLKVLERAEKLSEQISILDVKCLLADRAYAQQA